MKRNSSKERQTELKAKKTKKRKSRTNGMHFIHNEMALLCLNAKTLPILIWIFEIGFYSVFLAFLFYIMYYLFFIYLFFSHTIVKLSNEVLYFRKLSFMFSILTLCVPYAGPFHTNCSKLWIYGIKWVYLLYDSDAKDFYLHGRICSGEISLKYIMH